MIRRFLLLAVLLGAVCAPPARADQARVGLIFTTTVTATSVPISPTTARRKTFQACVAGTGSVTATIDIEVSNFPNSSIQASTALWKSIKTFSLSGTTNANDVFAIDSVYGAYRVNVSVLTGTNATATVYGGEEP